MLFRSEATAGYGVLRLLDERNKALAETAEAVKANNLKDVPARAAALAEENKNLARELQDMKDKVAAARTSGLFENAVDLNGVKVISAMLSGTDANALRTMCDRLRDKTPDVVAVLVGTSGDKISLAVTVGANALKTGIKAGVLVKEIAALAGGNGGGKPDFAMGSMKDDTKIDEALKAAPEIIRAHMN